jgi:outer membrane protein insertion porin family
LRQVFVIAGLAAALLAAIAVSLRPAPAWAQAADAPVVEQIVIEGNQRIEASTIASYLAVSRGDPMTRQALNRSLSSLFDTGLFADVVLRQEGNTLVVTVVENPIINRIAFEGNEAIDDETLRQEVRLRPRVVYTRTRVQDDVARLQEVYRRSGYFAADIEPQVIQLEQNRVDLVFEIEEGPPTRVRQISFVGNEAFSDGELRGVIATEEAAFWKILTANDTYDPDRLQFDQELLRRFYLAEGYADFRVISAVAELTPDNEDFFITFTVEEGRRYRFGEVDITSELPQLDTEGLMPLLETQPGEVYSSEDVEASIDALVDAVSDLQYAFVDVQPLITRDREQQLINVTYVIEEGPRVFVERIEIVGNVRTVDSVIRREMTLVEGDPFNQSKLRRSEARIRNLDFFSSVEINAVPGSAPDLTVIEVEVEEQSTGELSLGAGFSSIDGPLGSVILTERNLLGRGQRLRVQASLSGSTQEFDVGFTEPYFLERDLSAGFDIFRITRDNQDESSFDEESTGFGLRFGYPLAPRLRQTVRYRLDSTEISDIESDASRFIREAEGQTVTSLVGQEVVYEQLDSRIEPTDGYIVRFETDFAGLGGDVEFVRTVLGGDVFFPVLEDVVLNVSGEAGAIVGLGEDVRITDRFFIGGSDIRGFERSGVGPRDADTDDALGGNQFAVGSVEVGFPLGLPEEFGIRGAAFSDFGILTDVDDEGPEVLDETSIRVSVGAGVSWRSPFGPVRLDLAFPVVSEDFDREETFRFSFGTRF